jgi:glycine betaine/proline transport system permease protein
MTGIEQPGAEVHLTREQAIANFVGCSANYYQKQFDKLDDSAGPVFSFNIAAALLGPIWWSARHLWACFWIFLLLECIAVVQICRGLFADLGFEEFARAERLTKSAVSRRTEANDAIASGANNASSLTESASALETASSKALIQAEQIVAQAPYLIAIGIILIVSLKLFQGYVANKAMKSSFQRWRANRKLPSGINTPQIIGAGLLYLIVIGGTAYRFTANLLPEWMLKVPADPQWRRNTETAVDNGFQWMTESFSGLFGSITRLIRLILDSLEIVMVDTPWPIVMTVIILLAVKIAGYRVAIFTAVALAYLGILGFWEKSMLTVALLGAACLICIAIGIPLGILCARRKKVRAFVWPMLDLMQTMPSFVYLIPVIAFFGIGKPPGIIATIVFGMPPVVRLTVLGLQGVPSYVREAAEAFGASKMYLLFRVDLPLAKPSIMAGINQTILMCLSMVVIASLIGAKGLGEDVLDALTYANEGKGVLAGVAILFCAMVLDRIVQGKSNAASGSS